MSDTVIRVENLSKKYVLSHQQEGSSRYKSLRESISDRVSSLGKKLVKSSGKEIYNPAREEFWALKDVSFEIKQGESIGIIGRNGAGKSTLLKILSRITEPSSGCISLKGRVASLLEVGTGFHPELTGRENIYLNGAILGMSKTEIKRKFDEIVAFAEVEKFLDTPVKRYSSGMYVRLAFAVAAHLEPEILIVDEVLAVGDAQFQKKCLGKMNDVSEKEGRTVLFVSHNMAALKSLCDQAILLKSGCLVTHGETHQVVSRYLESDNDSKFLERMWDDIETAPGNDKIRIHQIKVIPDTDDSVDEITVKTPLRIEFEYWNYLDGAHLNLSLHIYTLEGVCVFNSISRSIPCTSGLIRGVCYIPEDFFNDGSYQITMMVVQDTSTILYTCENLLSFTVHDIEREFKWYGKWQGIVRPNLKWRFAPVEIFASKSC
ncbi:ABC transporter ATP-binding protein [Nostoc sp. ATCC 53789]|uniref:ABC transporter ATP-binding protein n=1 Tax=Nostoc sp. ATCC 53789 TaxID=76335 RepID=UPI000DECE601|nr:ABC transporter ATP-binding protein [Nostoc sp. ATCC 53789]QHG18536.1 ATP-binding cassette domain-containing protein [Nostoc sp. ATCC 53789]RCJ30376.1 ABC transporter [Nostoc sp. ATCC 53789]